MEDFFAWQLRHYKQRRDEVTDPAAKSFLRKQYYELSKSKLDDQANNHGNPFNYSGCLPIQNNAFFTDRGK